MKAHYFKSAKEQYVIISQGFSPTGQKIQVSGKREARAVAKKHNAEPNNF